METCKLHEANKKGITKDSKERIDNSLRALRKTSLIWLDNG